MAIALPTQKISLVTFHEAMEALADANDMSSSDPNVRHLKQPVWASKIVRHIDRSIETDAFCNEIAITADLFDYASEEVESSAASIQEGGTHGVLCDWHSTTASAYARYLEQLEKEHPRKAFDAEIAQVIAEHRAGEPPVIPFDQFVRHRDFSDLSSLRPGYADSAEAIGVTDYCVTYPGENILGYDPDTGEAWHQDYKEEFRGPIELIERKLYLWALVESGHMLEQ